MTQPSGFLHARSLLDSLLPEDLLGRVAQGDLPAFEVLYARISAPVYGMALRVLRDRAQAEEVAQEVLLWVWCEAGRYDRAQGAAMTWIMMIGHRRAVDRVRAEQSATRRHQRVAQLGVETAYDHVAEDVLFQLDREAVRHCLGILTATQRESVTLAYYGGHTYREVGAILGIPLGTVKSRIRDGLLRIRDCLAVPAGP